MATGKINRYLCLYRRRRETIKLEDKLMGDVSESTQTGFLSFSFPFACKTEKKNNRKDNRSLFCAITTHLKVIKC